MLKLGIQSRLLLGSCPLQEDFERIKQAGFDCIDFNLDRYLTNTEIYQGEINQFFNQSIEKLCDYFTQYFNMAQVSELCFSQVHAPYPLYVYGKESDKDYLHMVAAKSIAVCAALHSPYLVIHPFKLVHFLDADEEFRQNISFFKSLIPIAQKYDIKICLENLYDSFGGRLCDGVCSNPYQAVQYIDCLNEIAGEERFAFCFDVGHANLLGKDMYHMIQVLGKRLQVLHLHDNDGIKDLHQMPFTFTKELAGDVSTDWTGVIKGLQEIAFSGVLSFETFAVLNCFPKELHTSALKMIAGIGEYFRNQVECIHTKA